MERCPSHKSNLSLKIWPFQPLSSQFLQNYNKPLVLFDGKKGENIKICQPTFTPFCRYCSAIYLESDSVILFCPQRSKSFTHHQTLQFLIDFPYVSVTSEPNWWDIFYGTSFPVMSMISLEISWWDISVVEMIQLIQDNQVRRFDDNMVYLFFVVTAWFSRVGCCCMTH